MSTEALSNLALIKISGADATEFLQGQLTNDISLLNSNGVKTWQYNGYCNPKGRLLAIFLIWRNQGDYFAIIPADLIEQVLPRLRMFVMRSRVTVERQLDAIVYGQNSLQSIQTAENSVKLKNMQHQQLQLGNNFSYLVINQRVMVVSHSGASIAYDSSAATQWLSADIEQGIPQIVAGIAELFIPQMVNLDIIDGISFSKGCYTGQEIIARMHYLGNLKKRMFVCRSLATEQGREDKPLHPGDRIFTDAELTKAVGTIVNSAPDAPALLAVIRLTAIESDLYLKTGAQIKINQQQPYSITAD